MTFSNDKCNNCNQKILWQNPNTGKKEIHPFTGNARPLNLDGSLHLCMVPGQKQYFEKRKKGNRITDW